MKHKILLDDYKVCPGLSKHESVWKLIRSYPQLIVVAVLVANQWGMSVTTKAVPNRRQMPFVKNKNRPKSSFGPDAHSASTPMQNHMHDDVLFQYGRVSSPSQCRHFLRIFCNLNCDVCICLCIEGGLLPSVMLRTLATMRLVLSSLHHPLELTLCKIEDRLITDWLPPKADCK